MISHLSKTLPALALGVGLSASWPGTIWASSTASNHYRVGSGTVTFLATGKPGFLRINGKGGQPAGQFTMDAARAKLLSGEIKVALDPLKTGISLRDRHMKENYLETQKYPDAVFQADPVAFKDGKLPATLELPGTLTLHGVTAPVTASLSITRKGGSLDLETLDIEAVLETTLTTFKIKIPGYAGVTVADRVKVTVNFTALPAKP